MMNLVTFFMKPEIKSVQKLSEVGTTFLNDHDVTNYIYNHIEGSNALLTITNLQVGGPLIQKLKDYQADNKRLPPSFSTENVRRVYLAVKDKEMSDDMQQFFLYLFKSQNMTAEIVDLTQKMAESSDVKNYYLSDTLLNMNVGQNENYYSLIDKAVFSDESKKDSATYLSAMTKAYLQDGNTEYAL